ncbi:MAG: hypothetical protein AAF355_09605 [Myxococcota bacterium]
MSTIATSLDRCEQLLNLRLDFESHTFSQKDRAPLPLVQDSGPSDYFDFIRKLQTLALLNMRQGLTQIKSISNGLSNSELPIEILREHDSHELVCFLRIISQRIKSRVIPTITNVNKDYKEKALSVWVDLNSIENEAIVLPVMFRNIKLFAEHGGRYLSHFFHVQIPLWDLYCDSISEVEYRVSRFTENLYLASGLLRYLWGKYAQKDLPSQDRLSRPDFDCTIRRIESVIQPFAPETVAERIRSSAGVSLSRASSKIPDDQFHRGIVVHCDSLSSGLSGDYREISVCARLHR